MTPSEVARAGEMLIGVPYRLHGRDPVHGLDCVGVIAAALGRSDAAPAGYGLRHSNIVAFLPLAQAAGLAPATGPVAPGDVLLVRPGPGQHHLLLAIGPDTFVHAHAGLRRVVRHAGQLGWPVLRHWRLA